MESVLYEAFMFSFSLFHLLTGIRVVGFDKEQYNKHYTSPITGIDTVHSRNGWKNRIKVGGPLLSPHSPEDER